MDSQNQSDDPTSKKTVLKSSIKRAKEKFVPGVKYTLLASAIIQFSMLVIGCLNVHKCPVEKHIPLFLIAVGAIGLTAKFVSYIRNRISAHVRVVYIESTIYGAEMIFFFLGTYWVYKEFQPNYDPAFGKLYCNKTAYLFAFCYLTIFYIIVIGLIVGGCCFGCCVLLLSTADASKSDPEASESSNVRAPLHKDSAENSP